MIPLIDCHQHLMYRDKANYDWVDSVPALASKEYPLDQYKALTEGYNIIGTLAMEAAGDNESYPSETRHFASLVNTKDSGVLGVISSCRPEHDAGFSDWLDECEDLKVVGFRRVLHVMPDDFSATLTFRRNIQKIGDRGLPFDLCVIPQQFDQAMDLVGGCPNTVFVLDHLGLPVVSRGGFAQWYAGIKGLAEMPNVYCKLSGILSRCPAGQATLDVIAPYVDFALEVFGPSRMLWGSDWPVVNTNAGLPQWLDLMRSILSELAEDEAEAIGYKTAQEVYQLPSAA
jgi:predicted TIM-barrel fold metal-dependent hydrolase